MESYCGSSRVDESFQATNKNEQLIFQLSDFDDEKRLSSLTDYQVSQERNSLIDYMKSFIDKKLTEIASCLSGINIENDNSKRNFKISCKTVSDGKEEVEVWFKRIETDFNQLKNFVDELKESSSRLAIKVC